MSTQELAVKKVAPLVNASDLALVDNNLLNAKQLQHLLKQTPTKYVKSRPAKGGGTWKYVSGGYVKKILNLMFGWDWDFEIVEQLITGGEAIVKGKLTVRVNGKTISKMQFGNKDVMCKKGTDTPLSLGNDLKAAATDALKKCAAELGIAADVYNAEEFQSINVVDNTQVSKEELSELYELKAESCSEDLKINIERALVNNESNLYPSLYKTLQSL